MYEGKDEVEIAFTETLSDGTKIDSTVHIYKAREQGRDCIISETESDVLYVKSCVDLERGTPVYTRIVERAYDQAETLITYGSDEVTVEYKEDGKTRTDTLENDQVLDGYVLSFLFSALPYEELQGKKIEFQFLNYKKPSLINVSLTVEDTNERYKLDGRVVEAVKYKTKVQNFLIAMFTDPNIFLYGKRENTPVMLKYEGSDPSDIRSRIGYEIKPASYREALSVFNTAE